MNAAASHPTYITLNQIKPVELQRVRYLARAYVYEPQDFHQFEKTYGKYEDFRPFYQNRIEVQIDDYDASQIRDEVLTQYDMIVLTTPRDGLSQHDKTILEKFESSNGIVIASGDSAYDEISFVRSRFESGQLNSKQEIYIWEYHSGNLDIYYPEIPGWFTLENAQKNAAIAEQVYALFQQTIDERPFQGGAISIAFFKYRSNSMAGQFVRMGTQTEQGNLFPPNWTFYHEIAHDFTSNDGEPNRPRTSTAAYLDINIAFEEALANLFAFYFASTLGYDARLVQAKASFWKAKLDEYENRKINPYALNWHGHNEDQQYLEAMLFYISDTYGWETWNQFFRIAKQSDIPKIPASLQANMEDLTQREASLALSRLVYLLSLSTGDDLRRKFLAWGFRIEPEVESLKLGKIKEKTALLLTLSPNSVSPGDLLKLGAKLQDMNATPIAQETVDFSLERLDGTVVSLGRAETDNHGQVQVNYEVKMDIGIYWVIVSYEGSPSFIKTSQRKQIVVNSLSWKTLPDERLDLVDQRGAIVGDLGQSYVDVAGLNYSFSSESLYFQLSLQDRIPSKGTDSRVDSIWYQILLDVDSDSSTGFHWSSDFTPDYILQLYVKSDPLANWVEGYVMKYSGNGNDFTWTFIQETGRFGNEATIAGGIGSNFLLLECSYGDIPVSKGNTIRFFGRSGILFDDKVYNDPVPNSGTVALTLLPSAMTTSATTTYNYVATTSATTSSEVSSTVQIFVATAPVQMEWLQMALMLAIALTATGLYLKLRKKKVRQN